MRGAVILDKRRFVLVVGCLGRRSVVLRDGFVGGGRIDGVGCGGFERGFRGSVIGRVDGRGIVAGRVGGVGRRVGEFVGRRVGEFECGLGRIVLLCGWERGCVIWLVNGEIEVMQMWVEERFAAVDGIARVVARQGQDIVVVQLQMVVVRDVSQPVVEWDILLVSPQKVDTPRTST
jgi:hypothetical protein